MNDMSFPAPMAHAGQVVPGVYDDLDDETYHGDCCPGPSLSSTSIRQVLKDPGDFWDQSILNPAVKAAKAEERARAEAEGTAPPPGTRKFNKGKAAHLLLLEPHRVEGCVAVIPDDILASNGALSTKAAKAFVAEQTDLGRTVLKEEEWQTICDMADALSADSRVMRLLSGCKLEQSHIWQDHETGVYIKSRPDICPQESGTFVIDYKTTDAADIDQWVNKSLCDFRLDMQAALQMWGAHESLGIETHGVCYIVQSVKTKRVALRYITNQTATGRDLLAVARQDLRAGINTFARCWSERKWPSYWSGMAEMFPPQRREREIEKQLTDIPPVFPGEYAA